MGTTRARSTAAALLLVASALGCTSMRVTGTVRDRDTNKPVAGAVVTASGYPPAVVTDPDGNYSLKAAWQQVSLVAGAPCYETVTDTVQATNSRYVTKDLTLVRSPECGGPPSTAAR